jgi:uncharacterized protein DUF4349
VTTSTIQFLERLEADLELVAEDAAVKRGLLPALGGGGGVAGRGGRPTARRRRPAHGRWMAWSGAAAAIVVLAWGIGIVGGGMQQASEKFNEVGSAVGGAGGGYATGAGQVPAANPPPQVAPREPAYNFAPDASGSPAPDGSQPGVDLAKIDRDGSLTLKLDQGAFKTTFGRVIAIAEANGGMLLDSTTSGPDSGTLTLRIPADRFDRAFVAIGKLGAIRASEITGHDVTAQYLNLRAHLKIAKGRRDVLFGLYQQATTIPASLQVYNELERVQTQIDEIQGKIRYLNAQTSISTLEVTLSEREPEAAAVTSGSDIENPSLGRAWDRAVQGFLNVLTTVVVGLGYLVPLGILIGILALIVMLVRRRGPAAS